MSIIEQIKAEIKRLKEYTVKCGYPGQNEYADGNKEGRNFICDKLLSFLSTIEEKSEKLINQKELNVTDFCKPIDPDIAQCIADYSWEMLGEDEKSVTNDLEEATEKYVSTLCDEADKGLRIDTTLESAFKAGAVWQKEQNDKDFFEKITAAYQLGLADKEKQMMSEVVEGSITSANGVFGYDVAAFKFDDDHKYTILLSHKEGRKYGDKVRIAIVNEE